MYIDISYKLLDACSRTDRRARVKLMLHYSCDWKDQGPGEGYYLKIWVKIARESTIRWPRNTTFFEKLWNFNHFVVTNQTSANHWQNPCHW